MMKADPRFIPVATGLAGMDGFSLMESKSGATRGLMLDGKSFGMSSHGRLILKLTEARVAELLAAGIGVPFYPSPERPLKGWIEIPSPMPTGSSWPARPTPSPSPARPRHAAERPTHPARADRFGIPREEIAGGPL